MSERERLLDWQATLNTRELGGYPAKGGGGTRWQALVRSENPALLTRQGQQALVDYGIRTIIDLRYPAELEIDPSPFAKPNVGDATRPDYLNIPLDVDQDLEWKVGDDAARSMCSLYYRLLETNRGHVAEVLRAVARARPGGVLFHCHAGKDRTGLITAMLLSALGVSEEIIIQDYAFSTPQLQERSERELTEPWVLAEKVDFYRVLFSNLPDTMDLTLKYLKQTYGSAAGYLKTTALTEDDLAALRERLIE
jgi:protein tyrosine/serine phosphatase